MDPCKGKIVIGYFLCCNAGELYCDDLTRSQLFLGQFLYNEEVMNIGPMTAKSGGL